MEYKVVVGRMSWWAQPLAYLTLIPATLAMVALLALLFVALIPLALVVALDGGKALVRTK